MLDIIIENVNDQEMIEYIKVFDDEMNLLLGKSPEWIDLIIEKYIRNDKEINMYFSWKGKEDFLALPENYFEDYCFSTRKERNTLIKKMLTDVKSKLDQV